MENKFRFWTPDKRMIYDHDGWMEGIGINEMLYHSKEYGYIPMQYTNLKDKNGKEIYASDILLDSNGNKKYRVFNVAGGFAINTHQDDLDRNTPFYTALADMQTASYVNGCCEVIGNIHQTPEYVVKF